MKICEKCGAHNSDNRVFCIDCGETLGDKISDLHERQIRKGIDEKIEKMYNKGDPLVINLFEKIFGGIAAIGTLVAVVFIIINLIKGRSIEYLFGSIFVFALAMFEAFLPKISWALERRQVSIYANGADGLQPNDYYFITKRIAITLLTVAGVIALAVGIA